MKKSLLIIFLLLIAVPISVMTWMGYSGYRREKTTVSERYSILARKQLEEIDRLIVSHIGHIEESLYFDGRTLDAEDMRNTARQNRLVKQVFAIDDEDRYLFPDESGVISGREEAFLLKAAQLEIASVIGVKTADSALAGNRGWYTWFVGDGVNFIFWWTDESKRTFGVELERMAFMSSVIAILPETGISVSDEDPSRIILTDARGNALYQWGSYLPAHDEHPLAELALSPPLGAWHLGVYADLGAGGFFAATGGQISLLFGVLGLAVAVTLAAVYFYRENKKIMRDALQKVSFVNQVSHELKTPLTNIRLYAELLETKLSEKNEQTDINVILMESRRLSRMINNVLTFSRGENTGFEANLETVVPDEVIQRVMDTFGPSLADKSIEVVLNCKTPMEIRTDPDFIEQILSNLVGNVEKYAAGGGYLEITSTRDVGTVSILVADRGPGIPSSEQKNIFRPFYRIDNSLTEGVSGAGIGLTISRRLSETLGGSLTLESSGSGSVFKLIIPVEGKAT